MKKDNDYNPIESIRRFFRSKEEKEAEKERIRKVKDEEKNLIKELQNMDDNWHKYADRKTPNYDAIFAPTLDYEEKKYDNTPLSELKKKAEAKYSNRYNADRHSVMSKYADSYKNTQKDVEDIYNNESKVLKELAQKHSRKARDTDNKNVDKGISKSTIARLMQGEVENDARRETGEVRTKADRKVRDKLSNLERLNHERDRALGKIDASASYDIGKETQRLTEEKERKNNDAKRYNDMMKEKAHLYNLKRQDTIDKIEDRAKKHEQSERYYEAKIGMRPDKAENYRERTMMAYRLYEQIPREAAVEAIKNNHELKRLLGAKHYYALLAYERNRGPM